MKVKVSQIIFSVLYLIVKYCPKSSSHIPFMGRARSFIASKVITKCGTNVNIERGATFSRRLSLGNNSGLGVNCQIQGTVIIGNDVMMGPEVFIYTTNHSFEKTDIPMRLQGYQEEKPVYIGDDVWIGSRVTILPGVMIGSGSIIGAGSVVTKDVPPYAIIAGNPAILRKMRK